jgi:hypothetical protein
LFVFWEADNDIVYRSYNSSRGWGALRKLTNSQANNYCVKAHVHEGKLWALWVSEDPALTNGTDSDIVLWGEDGVFRELTPQNDEDYVDQHPTILTYGDTLYAIWQTNNPQITNGTDDDIVARALPEGAFWELADTEDSDFTARATVIGYVLYAVWLRGEVLVLFARCDGNETLSTVATVTTRPTPLTRACADLCVHNNSLYLVFQSAARELSAGTDMDIVCFVYELPVSETQPVRKMPQADNQKFLWWLAGALVCALAAIFSLLRYWRRKTHSK